MSTLQLGDPLEVTIDSLAYRGAGVGRSDGRVVFIHGTCPGERVTARVTKVQPRFLEAELTAVAESSPSRIAPVCRVPGADGAPVRVPGCVYDHLAYPAEVEAKQLQLAGFLSRQARMPEAAARLLPPIPSPAELHYRNKIVLHAGFWGEHPALGYVGDDNRSVVDLPACPLAVPAINDRLRALRADPSFREDVRPGANVTLRWTPADGVVAWIDRPALQAPPLHEATAFGTLEVPAGGFFQVNLPVAARLVELVLEAVARHAPTALVDLYCGVGVFALAAAKAGVRRCLGVESGRAAIAAAHRNAARLGLKAAEFACAPAAEGLASALNEVGVGGTFVVLDPPREGLDAGVRRILAERRPPHLAYVSCSPDTLARDLAELARDGGYEIEEVRLLDMFPRTAHFETLTLLTTPQRG